MKLYNDQIILRDFIERDILEYIYWATTETEWQLWDAPWEHEGGDKNFSSKKFEDAKLDMLSKPNDENKIRNRFEICINDSIESHIGWTSSYYIDKNYEYTTDEGMYAIGIDIPNISFRKKGYATEALNLFIDYLISEGVKEIYTQTWSGNERMIGLAKKLGFEECHRIEKKHWVRGKVYDSLTFKLNIDNRKGDL